MRKTLKITSIALALVLALGMLTMAFAAEGSQTGAPADKTVEIVNKGAIADSKALKEADKTYANGKAQYVNLEKVLGAQYTADAKGNLTENWALLDSFELERADGKEDAATFLVGPYTVGVGKKFVVLHWNGSAWQKVGESETVTAKVNEDSSITYTNASKSASVTAKVTSSFSPFAVVEVGGSAAVAGDAAKAPQTGDSSVMLWGALMMVAVAGAVIVSKKHKNEA